jgi:hypothetical protein
MMKIYRSFLTLGLLFLLLTTALAQTKSDNRAVRAYATIENNSDISLRWEPLVANATGYAVYRRDMGAASWGAAIATLNATGSAYTDANVSANQVYEYRIEKTTSLTDPFGGGAQLKGYSYISAAVEKPAVHTRGIFWVLASKNIMDSLPGEVEMLTTDLVGDGWEVYVEVINPTAKVQDVKALIDAKYNSVGCDALLLLGHIPVPYSGLYCQDPSFRFPPDGHASNDPTPHCGAWAADVYYGVIDGAWTDTDSTTLAFRPENDNLIGDGKFDNAIIPGTVVIQVGRADFSRMPLFDLTEIGLTKQYLDKTHAYKQGNTPTLKKGVVENNFAAFDEGFSSGALRDFTAICGENSIVEDDVLTANETENYLLNYSCGPGSYTTCGGFGISSDFKTKNAGAFLHLFGSFFGDWDIENNLLRASLCTEEMGFATMWSGRPKWATHTLALGGTYGDAALITQNNVNGYDGSFYQNATHIALLGDPSLRHDMMSPALNIALEANSNRSATTVTWDASTEANIDGYYVYRSHKGHGDFILLNTTPTTDLNYIDSMPYDGTNHYMVRVAKVIETGSGNYENLSLGVQAEINAMQGQIANVPAIANIHLKVYPTVASDNITIEKSTGNNAPFSIRNTLGASVKTGTISGYKQAINVSQLAQGVYYVTVSDNTIKFIKH